MERPVSFLQSLLVLVVAIQVISACECGKQRTMEESICANETMVMGTPKRVYFENENRQPVTDKGLAYYRIYKTDLQTMYHEGPNKMRIDHRHFELVTPQKTQDCGLSFKLNTEYYIAGTAREDNSLLVTSCDFVAPVPWNLTHDELELMNDLLTRQSHLDCSALA